MNDPLEVRCPTYGTKVEKACELATGHARTYPHLERLLTEKKSKEEMIARLRAELVAIAVWDNTTEPWQTQIEKDAAVSREVRRQEIEALLLEIATRN